MRQNDSHHCLSQMANTALVSKTHITPSGLSEEDTTKIQAVSAMGPPSNAHHSQATVTCSENIRRHYEDMGFSLCIASVLSRSLQDSTKAEYHKGQQLWYDFTRKWKINTDTASVSDLAEFFAIQFSTGTSSYKQIIKLRASISTLFEHRPETLSQSPTIQRLFRAFFNINLPQAHTTLQWNPDDLLELLKTDKYNEELTLQTLGTKTATLILLATACRKYELRGIDLNHMTFHQDLVHIKLVTLPKNFTKERPDPEICEFKILENPHNQRLCPVFHIKKYIETTQNIRNTTRLFITSTPPFRAVSQDRLGKWIKTLLKQMPTKLQPGASFQSPRSAVSSALFDKGVPLDRILAHCRWSTSSVFFKYYYKHNPTQPEASYHKVMYNKKPKATHTQFRKPPAPISLINIAEQEITEPSTSTHQETTTTLPVEPDPPRNSHLRQHFTP